MSAASALALLLAVVSDAETQAVVRRLGEGPAFVGDVHDRTVVCCGGPCPRLHLTDLDGEERTFGLPETDQSFDVRSARLSFDGRYVTAIAGEDGPGEPNAAGTVILVDVATGRSEPITPPLEPRPAYLGWAPDGSQLFFSSHAYGASQTNVGRYRMTAEIESGSDDNPGEQLELLTLPIGGTLSFVTLHQEGAAAFLEGAERIPARGEVAEGVSSVPSYDRAVELAADGTPMVGTVGYGGAGLDVVSAAVVDSGAVALLGHRLNGRLNLVVLPLAELPDLTQASGPFFEGAVSAAPEGTSRSDVRSQRNP